MKTCSKCKKDKELYYFRIVNEYYRGECKVCEKLYYIENREKLSKNRKEYKEVNKIKLSDDAKKYRSENKEDIRSRSKKVDRRIYQKEYRNDNKDKIKVYKKKYVDEHAVDIKITNKKYREDNKETINNKRNSDPLLKLKHNIRGMIGSSLRNKGYRKNTKTEKIIGCSFLEFKLYLESKFEAWMDWDNRGICISINSGWDIDHIIPLSSGNSEEDILKLNHYTNLQPLCSYINRYIKKDKLDYEM